MSSVNATKCAGNCGLVTFTKEILIEKLYFLRRGSYSNGVLILEILSSTCSQIYGRNTQWETSFFDQCGQLPLIK